MSDKEADQSDIAMSDLRAVHPDPMQAAERGYAKVGLEEPTSDTVELRHLRTGSVSSQPGYDDASEHLPHPTLYQQVQSRRRVFWNRFTGKGREVPGFFRSLKNIVMSSWINTFFVFIPLAWISHWMGSWSHVVTFTLCFLAIIPLEKMFDWGGEQMALFLGKDLGDLVIVTLNNAVEAALAIALLRKCELRLLQATIIGVVILHLLLIPGTAFLAGGAQIQEQTLHPHHTELNHSLLALGVLTVLLPTAFFAALDRGAQSIATNGKLEYSGGILTDEFRDAVLRMSRGLAVILLIIYVASRIFLHNPPGEGNALSVRPDAPAAHKEEEELLREENPEVNVWVCMVLLLVTIALMAATAEFLVEAIEPVREAGNIVEEWFGLILLPIVSFSADGVIAIVFFARSFVNHVLGKKTMVPEQLAKARAIDLSIQFTLFWMPFLVLLGWWIDRPMHLLFDYFELAIVLGSCFLVNYVTADSKTNWVEGFIMVAFYFMIAITTWFYVGQPEIEVMLSCPGSVAQALLEATSESVSEDGGEGTTEAAGEIVERAIRAFL